MTDLTDADLDRIETCLPLLPEPGPEVAAELVAEVRRLRDAIREHRTDVVELLDRPTTSIDLALWALLDDQEDSDG